MFLSEVTQIPFPGPPEKLPEGFFRSPTATEPPTDPLLLDFLAFAERKGRGREALRWAADPASLAEGRVAEAVLAASNKRNAFRGLLRELARPTPFR